MSCSVCWAEETITLPQRNSYFQNETKLTSVADCDKRSLKLTGTSECLTSGVLCSTVHIFFFTEIMFIVLNIFHSTFLCSQHTLFCEAMHMHAVEICNALVYSERGGASLYLYFTLNLRLLITILPIFFSSYAKTLREARFNHKQTNCFWSYRFIESR